MVFQLDRRLEADSVPVDDLGLSTLRLMRDANYPWLMLVPRRANTVEIIDLSFDDQAQLMREIAVASAALKAITRCDKLNVGALGNMVPQLHVHIIARFEGDVAWPGPVWGKAPPQAYQPGAIEAFIEKLRATLGA